MLFDSRPCRPGADGYDPQKRALRRRAAKGAPGNNDQGKKGAPDAQNIACCRCGRTRRFARRGAAGDGAGSGPRDPRAGCARWRLGPDRPGHAERAAGGRPGKRHPGRQHPWRRRHDRSRPVRLRQGGPGQRPDGRRSGHAGRDPDQSVAGHARAGDADRAADRRVRGDRGAGELRHPDPRRPDRPVQGRSPVGLVGRRLGRRHRPHAGRPDRQGRPASSRAASTTCRLPAAARRWPRSSAATSPPASAAIRSSRARSRRAICVRSPSLRPSAWRASTSRPSRSRASTSS